MSNTPEPKSLSLVVFLSSWLTLCAVTAVVFASIGVLHALVSGNEGWETAARGAGMLGGVVGALMGFGLSIAFGGETRVREVLVVGLGALLFAELAAGLAYWATWTCLADAAPFVAGVVGLVGLVLAFSCLALLFARQGDKRSREGLRS